MFNLANGQHAVNDMSKDSVLPVQKVRRSCRDEELKEMSLDNPNGAEVPGSHLYSVPSLPANKGEVTERLSGKRTMDKRPASVCLSLKFSSLSSVSMARVLNSLLTSNFSP